MADLTRFDFHALRFSNSEQVQMMTAEEVGQYVLLLVAAWLGGKDASLPDNPTFLARIARSERVSDTVLAMFPVVETAFGQRRQNETLFREWQATVARSEAAKAKAELRWGSDEAKQQQPVSNAGAMLLHKRSNAAAHAHTNPNQDQTKPAQAEPDQAKPNPLQTEGGPSEAGALSVEAAASSNAPDFKAFRITWRALIKKPLGHNKKIEADYLALCEQYGSNNVLRALNTWAQPHTVEWAKSVDHPFGAFRKQLATIIEREAADAEEAAAAEKLNAKDEVITLDIPAATPAQLEQTEKDISEYHKQVQAAREARRKRFAGAASPVSEADPSEYVS